MGSINETGIVEELADAVLEDNRRIRAIVICVAECVNENTGECRLRYSTRGFAPAQLYAVAQGLTDRAAERTLQ